MRVADRAGSVGPVGSVGSIAVTVLSIAEDARGLLLGRRYSWAESLS